MASRLRISELNQVGDGQSQNAINQEAHGSGEKGNMAFSRDLLLSTSSQLEVYIRVPWRAFEKY